MSLLEVLVASALLVVVLVAVLARFDSARRRIVELDDSVELQQSLRAALDVMARDIGAAGLDVDPDGDPQRPDEAIEGAWGTALVVRGNLDAATEHEDDPEAALAAGGAFANVTTGNDEIVGYALARHDGASQGAFAFLADVRGVPRDGIVEQVVIGSVSSEQNERSFTLYRFTVRKNSTVVVRTPVADGIRSLRWTYFDSRGEAIEAPGGDESIGARRARARIRRVRIEIEGVVRGGRTLALALDLSPRNLGLASSE